MNRIASRSWITVLLALLLVAGIVFFVCEYFAQASEWALFSGSPHVYTNGDVAGVITDRGGVLLSDTVTDTYADSETLRKAVLHWVGDRAGNIYTPVYGCYAKQMSGYDVLNGVYRYGEGSCEMTLTLSASVQTAAYEALDGRHGTIAVYNYRTGEVLCAVSSPTFDPENVPDIASDGDGTYDGVYLNRFTDVTYTPGSVFKTVTLAAAIETIPDLQDLTFTCEEEYIVGDEVITCMGYHGEQTVEEAFANSCNCAFAQLAQLVGAETLSEYVAQLRITQPISFDGITTASGNFDLSHAGEADLCWSAIGQYTDQLNPCRLMTLAGAIAGGGSAAQPHIVSQIAVGGSNTYRAKTVQGDTVLSAATAEKLQEYLRNNVETVYGDWYFPGLTVCGKSGTAEVGGDRRPTATFTGFIADEEYPLAFAVFVEEGGYGGDTCVPILSGVLAACKAEMDGE